MGIREIVNRGAKGLSAAELLWLIRDAQGVPLIPEPTGAALNSYLRKAGDDAAAGAEAARKRAEAAATSALDAAKKAADQATSIGDISAAVGSAQTARDVAVQQASSVLSARPSLGEKVGVAAFAGEAQNGAALIVSGGKNVGYSIPAGQTGAVSYTWPQISFTVGQAAALAGATIRVKTVAVVTAGFLAEKPLTAAALRAIYADATQANVGAIVRSEQVGTLLYREATIVVTANLRAIGTPIQLLTSAANVTANAHSCQVVSTTIVIETLPGAATGGADYAISQRLDERAKPIEDNVAANGSAIAGAAATARAAQLTAGELPLTGSSGQVFNGAALINDANGVPVGVTLPAGSTGATSYITPNISFTDGQRTSLAGRTIRLKAVVALSPGFAIDRALNTSAVNATTLGGVTRQNQGTLVRNEIVGNVLYREALYTVVGDEAKIAQVFQVPGAGSASAIGAHSFQVTSITYLLEATTAAKASTANDEQLGLRLDAFLAALGLAGLSTSVASKHFGFCDRLADLTPAPQYFNGAVARAGADGRNWGWTVPVGATGTTTLMQFSLDLLGLGSLLAGRRVRVSLGCSTSDNYQQIAAGGVLQVRRPAGDANPTTATIRNAQVSTNRRIVEFEATLDGTETILKPYISRGTQNAAAAEQYLLVTDIVLEIVSSPSDLLTLQEENLRFGSALRAAAQSAAITTAYTTAIQTALTGGSGYAVTKTVKADGTGDYTHPRFAVEAITDASPSKRYRVLIYPGLYTGQANWLCKDYVDLVGIDRRGCVIHYENPDNIDLATIPATQTIWCNTETAFENLTVTIRNGRYPIHSDSSGNLKGRKQRLRNCHIEHLGNDGARAYQAANGGNPASVWASEHAWGYGSSSGMTVEMDRGTTLRSKISALYIHTREDFAEPCVMDVRNIRAIATNDTGAAVTVQPLGSGRNDLLLLNDSELVGDMRYAADPWISTVLANQPSSHAEVAVVGSGNSPVVFTTSDFGRALKIESADTTNASAVTVSGTAVPIIFGDVVSLPGSGGLKGYVYGKADISGAGVGLNKNVFITSLGQRLGDCTASPKTLSVAFQGGAAIVVTFDQNYSAVSNATILAAIQAAIGAAGTVSAYAVGERFRPSFLDQEQVLRNTSAVALPMFSALAYDTNHKTVRLMTSADPASRFAGIAWEDIYPAGAGRVKTSGYLPIGDLLRTDAAAFAFGDTFSVDAAMPGRVFKGGGQGLLSAIRSDAVRVR